MRALIVGVAIVISVAAAAVGTASAQTGYDRPGGDYAHAPVANGDPSACAARCERDKSCRSWSFSYPPLSGGPAQCWLKRHVMPPVPSSCCVSGVRGAGVIEPRGHEREYSIDRTGGDYRTFETKSEPNGRPARPRVTPTSTAAPGPIGGRVTALGTALLPKEAIKPPRHRPCCISGVVR